MSNTVIKHIKVVDFKGVEKFEADFGNESNVWIFLGDNETFKTTIIEAIFATITGTTVGKEKIRRGAKKSMIEATIYQDNKPINVKLSITPSGDTITITMPDGTVKKNKADLRALFPYIDIDVDEFINWSTNAEGRKKQVDLVRNLLPQDVNIKINELEQKVKDEEPNRKAAWNNMVVKEKILKELQEELEDDGDIIKYAEPIDVTKVSEELGIYTGMENQLAEAKKHVDNAKTVRDKAQEGFNSKVESFNKSINEKETQLSSYDKELADKIEQLKKEYEEKKQRSRDDISELNADKAAYEKEFQDKLINFDNKTKHYQDFLDKSKVTPGYVAELRQKLSEAEIWNTKHNHIKRIKKAGDDWEQGKEDYQAKLKEIQGYEKQREQLIKANPLPVKGLTFDDSGLKLKDLPFESLSTSQQIYASLNLIMAVNSKTKLFRLNRGESLAKNMDIVIDYAKQRGYGGFIEFAQYGAKEIVMEIAEVRNPDFVKANSAVKTDVEASMEVKEQTKATDDITEPIVKADDAFSNSIEDFEKQAEAIPPTEEEQESQEPKDGDGQANMYDDFF